MEGQDVQHGRWGDAGGRRVESGSTSGWRLTDSPLFGSTTVTPKLPKKACDESGHR